MACSGTRTQKQRRCCCPVPFIIPCPHAFPDTYSLGATTLSTDQRFLVDSPECLSGTVQPVAEMQVSRMSGRSVLLTFSSPSYSVSGPRHGGGDSAGPRTPTTPAPPPPPPP